MPRQLIFITFILLIYFVFKATLALRTGEIRVRFLTSKRASDPFGFWMGVVSYYGLAIFALVLLFRSLR